MENVFILEINVVVYAIWRCGVSSLSTGMADGSKIARMLSFVGTPQTAVDKEAITYRESTRRVGLLLKV